LLGVTLVLLSFVLEIIPQAALINSFELFSLIGIRALPLVQSKAASQFCWEAFDFSVPLAGGHAV
jgi:hypothetical protein